MSTILKALRKLEHDKQAEAARQRAHDPLAPAPEPMLAAPEASRGGAPTLWLLAGSVVVMFAIGLGFGLYSVSIGGGGDTAGSREVAASANAQPVVARGQRPDLQRPRPIAGVEPMPAPVVSSGGSVGASTSAVAPDPGGVAVAASSQAGAPSSTSASAPDVAAEGGPPPVDPWEAAALAPRDEETNERGEGEEDEERDRADRASPSMAAAAGASRSTSRTPPRDGSAADAPRDVAPVSAAPPVSDVGVGVAIDTLPEVELPPEPPPSASAPTRRAASPPKQASAPSGDARSAPPRESTPPTLGEVEVPGRDARIEVVVVKTIWHPKPERRLAQLQIGDGAETITVREADSFAGYTVEEITPSSVVLSRGDVTLTRRVGR